MKKVMLIIRDGWGHGEHKDGNAIFKANTPNHDFYKKNYPTTILQCTGNAVGNPEGVQGGSEVGHLTIGAGRIVWQPYELINQEIKNGNFFKNNILIDAIEHAKSNGTDLHIAGLFSDQGVHADYRHMTAILELCRQQSFDSVFIHLILDGRDVPEKSAMKFLTTFEEDLERIGVGKIATVVGRYYSMDRDKNWDRTLKGYNLMVNGDGFVAESAKEAIEKAYERGDKTDYYVQPTVIVDQSGNPVGLIKENDSFVFYNFRSDRARQITAMMTGPDYCPQKPEHFVNVYYTCFCRYEPSWTLPVAFPQHKVLNNLGQIISGNKLRQLRIAETEKYAHVTFFFNSQDEEPYENEDRIMVPSPKVSSYDQKPEMSAYEVTEKLLEKIGEYDFIAVNYANPDLVGHSGVFSAAVKACEVVDECVGNVVKKALENDYTILLMADHGNADHMLHEDGSKDPSHGLNPVLMTLISNDKKLKTVKLKEGRGPQDIAPTILDIMGLEKPKDMTGESLIEK